MRSSGSGTSGWGRKGGEKGFSGCRISWHCVHTGYQGMTSLEGETGDPPSRHDGVHDLPIPENGDQPPALGDDDADGFGDLGDAGD